MDPQAQQQAVHFSNNNNNNNNSNNSNGGSNNTQQSPPPQLQQQQYSLPGVLHFLQVEWRRFERERNEWELERADMKARLSFLEGERRGMENSKADLMRRVKMLEFALRQERGKYLSLQNATKGAVPSSSDTSETKMNTTFSPSQSPEPEQPSDSGGDSFAHLVPGSVVREGLNGAPHVPSYTPGPLMMYSKGVGNIRTRELLKNYLREANYLLAHSGYSGSTPSPRFPNRQPSDTSIANDPVISKRSSKNVLVEEVVQPSSNSVVVREESNNPPKASAPVQILKRAPSSEEFPSVGSNPSPSPNTDAGRKRRTPSKQRKGSIQAGPADFMDQDSGVPTVPEASAEVASVEDEETRDSNVLAPRQSSASFVPDNDDQVIWRPKASLRSHLDSVRSVAFLPSNDLALVSGSEDGTAKLWNIRSLQSSRKTPSDIEPVYTFRGHNSGVTSVALSPDGQSLYTGSLDSTIIAWRIPNVTRETYSATDNSTLHQKFVAHTNAVWDVKLNPMPDHLPVLASASSDLTVKLWDVREDASTRSLLRNTIREPEGKPYSPTSVEWLRTDPKRLAVAFQNSSVVIFDIETNTPLLRLKSDETYDGSVNTQINSIVCHPTMPLLVTAHEDRYIRLFDLNTGDCTHSMIAHLDAVSSVDFLAGGTTLVSSGHDCSLRWWDLSSTSRTCIQEHTTHRRKLDEGIWCVRTHPTKANVMASGGADGLCKVFFHGDAKSV